MPKKVLDTTNINITRLALIQKGYLTQGDIKAFVPCGKIQAADIYSKIREKVKEKEGLECCRKVILAKRILEFIDLTAEGIAAAAKLERKIQERE